jgi:hypothetical protein
VTRQRVLVAGFVVVVVAILAGGAALAFRDGESGVPFCTQLNDIYRSDAQAGQINLEDLAATDEQLTDFRDRFAALRDAAPDEVEADVTLIADFGEGIAQAALSHPPEETLERQAALVAASANAAEVNGALQRLEAYRAAEC